MSFEFTGNTHWSPDSGDFARKEAEKQAEQRRQDLARQQERDRNARFKAALQATASQSQPRQGQSMDSFIKTGGNRGVTVKVDNTPAHHKAMLAWMRGESAKKK